MPFVQGVPGGPTPPSLPPSNASSLRILATGPCELRFQGMLASHQVQLELKRNIADLHQRIIAGGCPTVTVDVEELQFVDSSALRIFVDWIARAAECKYKLIFITDPTMTWQRLSFSALKTLASDAVEIREKESALAPKSEPNP